MKPGDLVKHARYNRTGVIVSEMPRHTAALNRIFRVSWAQPLSPRWAGRITTVWDYDLETLNES